ncbi:HINT domain-containing protein [Actinophytocola gossypii]|uniref:Hint domain-containing protein n=1 Tax=Actinophytocola gossypii TaxID=2812003 RepID=A0ABT2JJA6_9PSEU|nr:HINT domain-containing protein [Actinophytocola gossypii]MCT2587967.1 hypothetical protein [Actinophytocola gossypii]
MANGLLDDDPETRQNRLRVYLADVGGRSKDDSDFHQVRAAFCHEFADDPVCRPPGEPSDGGGFLRFIYELTPISDAGDCLDGSVAGCAWLVASFIPGSRVVRGIDKATDAADTARSGVRSCKTGGNSFVPGTEVLMADGATKPIEDIEVGDHVLATDPVTGETGAREVVATIVGQGRKNLVEVTIDTDGPTGDQTGWVVATANHPFWIDNHHRWTNAEDLGTGDNLRVVGSVQGEVLATRSYITHQRVHNLTIKDIHTYHVVASRIPVLVHNCGNWSTHHEDAGDLAKRYTEGQATRDPASQWYHEELSNDELLAAINNVEEGDAIVVSRSGMILGGHHRWDELQRRIKDGRIDPGTPIRIDVYNGGRASMSMIHSTDPDFCICRASFDTLLEIQLEAESRGWATRWTSVEALRSQVKEELVVLQSLMREERGGTVRAFRCLVLFSAVDGREAGGVATIDLDPVRFGSLERIDRDPDVRRVLARMFSLASGGISMVSKK